MESWAEPNTWRCPSSWTLHLHPDMLNELVVLHELAHCLAPRHAGDVRQLRRGRLVHHRLHWHGPTFTGVLSELVRRFGTGVNHEDLAAAYRHYEVPVMDVEEVFAARAHSDEVEQILAGQFAAADEHAAASEAGPGTRPPARVSSLGWGWWLMEMRRCQRPGALVSRAALAASVSPVEPCTARDIKSSRTRRRCRTPRGCVASP